MLSFVGAASRDRQYCATVEVKMVEDLKSGQEALRVCVRCGRNGNIETHHITPKRKGGSDEQSNKEDRCGDCHKYHHAKEYCLEGLIKAVQKGSYGKAYLWLYRLEVIDRENTVGLVRMRGYYTYWNDERTHQVK